MNSIFFIINVLIASSPFFCESIESFSDYVEYVVYEVWPNPPLIDVTRMCFAIEFIYLTMRFGKLIWTVPLAETEDLRYLVELQIKTMVIMASPILVANLLVSKVPWLFSESTISKILMLSVGMRWISFILQANEHLFGSQKKTTTETQKDKDERDEEARKSHQLAHSNLERQGAKPYRALAPKILRVLINTDDKNSDHFSNFGVGP